MSDNKLQKFWHNPYWAPVTEPLKNVARITRAPINDFIREVQDAWQDDYGEGSTKIGRLLSSIGDSPNVGTFFMSMIGIVCGALACGGAGGMAAYFGMAGAGTAVQLGATAAAAIGAAGIGVVTGPFVVAGVVAAGAAVVGCALGIVPGIIGGGIKAVKHHIQQKNAPAVAAATAAVTVAAPASPRVNEKVSAIVKEFMTLPYQSREALFTELERISGVESRYPAEKVVAAIRDMPDADRVAVIEKLQDTLSVDFGAVAAKQALEIQDDEVEVYKKPIRLRSKNKTPAASGST